MNTFSKNSNIIIICPSQMVTGGPEALHQLSDQLIQFGLKNVFIHYTPAKKNAKPVNYNIYKTLEIKYIEDSEINVLVIPESMTNLVKKYPKSQKIIWWLSVDFYKTLMNKRIRKQNIFSRLFYNQKDREYFFEDIQNLFQWAQSFRSRKYLLDHQVSEGKINFVCDYVNPIFLENNKIISKDLFNNKIIYNPRKGQNEIAALIKNSPELNWVPIQNMNAEQIKNLMSECLVYVDFGENPGRDKMLRESVSQDCCIVSGTNGSSFYYEDLMIPEDYKFHFSQKEIPNILAKIKEVLHDYKNHIKNFQTYKNIVKAEKFQFENVLKEVFVE